METQTLRVKTGGRQAGTPNRITKRLRLAMADVLENEMEHLPTLLMELEPRDRVAAIIKLAPYVLPSINEAEPWDIKPMGGDWGEPL